MTQAQLKEIEDHPESAVDGWCNRVEEKKDQDFRKGDIPLHVVLHAHRHEVNHIQEGGYVVCDEHAESILQKPSDEKTTLSENFDSDHPQYLV